MGAIQAARGLVTLQPDTPPQAHLAAAVGLLRALPWPAGSPRGGSVGRRGRRRAAWAIAWVDSGEVTSTNRITSAALVMISALRVDTAASSARITAGPVIRPAGWNWWKMSGLRSSP